jgi:hypothetical protein
MKMNPATLLLLIQLTELVAEILQNIKLGKGLTPEQIKSIEARQATEVNKWKASIGNI